VGFVLRWPGHSNLPSRVSGWQPKTGYLPLGAMAWYAFDPGGEHQTLVGNDLRVLDRDSTGRRLRFGVRYIFKARVETLPGLGGRYRFKIWPADLPEPAGWDLSGQEGLDDPQSGCAVLVAHNVDASFGDVVVTPIRVPAGAVAVRVVGGGHVVKDPDQPAYGGGDVVALAAASDPGWRFERWEGGVSGTANPAHLTVNGDQRVTAIFRTTASASGLTSDDFSGPSLNSGIWRIVDPLADAVVTQAGGRLTVTIPQGVSHDAWTSGNHSTRIMQTAADVNFEVETRFNTMPPGNRHAEGVIVEEDADHYLRFDVQRDARGIRTFSAAVDAGIVHVWLDSAVVSGQPLALRVRRDGELWSQWYSADGTTWSSPSTFRYPLAVTSVGPFFATGSPSPEVLTGAVDHFRVLDWQIPEVTSATTEVRNPPSGFRLAHNYPNPFNSGTTIVYSVPEDAAGSIVTMRVYDALGREVTTLENSARQAGTYRVFFDARNLSSGTYFYRLQAAGGLAPAYRGGGRMVLLR
jgi:hypothetical protein